MSKMSKKNKSILLATIIVIIAVFIIIISVDVFVEPNPLRVATGFIQVCILDKECYEIQEYPRIMIWLIIWKI